MIYPIRYYGDPVLRKVARPVTSFDDELEALSQDMLETMYDANGVGLAAPQIGLSKRLFVALQIEPLEDEEQDEAEDLAALSPEEKRKRWGVVAEHVMVMGLLLSAWHLARRASGAGPRAKPHRQTPADRTVAPCEVCVNRSDRSHPMTSGRHGGADPPGGDEACATSHDRGSVAPAGDPTRYGITRTRALGTVQGHAPAATYRRPAQPIGHRRRRPRLIPRNEWTPPGRAVSANPPLSVVP